MAEPIYHGERTTLGFHAWGSRTPLRWGAVFGGLAVALVAYAGLMALGLAFGGGNLKDVIQGQDTARGLGIGAALWIIASVFFSLFAGSYIAGRLAGRVGDTVGHIHGTVVACAFFLFLSAQASSLVGFVGKSVGTAVGTASAGATAAATSPVGREIISDAIGDLDLKSSPETVTAGLASRLIRGNTEAALSYLAYQAGISRTEAQRRLDTFQTRFQQAVTDAGVAAARAIRTAGWLLFGAIFLGTITAMLGSAYGVKRSTKLPLELNTDEPLRRVA